MTFKILFALAFVAVAASIKIQRQDDDLGGYHGYEGGHHQFEGHGYEEHEYHGGEEHHEEHHEEEEHHHDEPAEYSFHYDVHDDHTGDIKSHSEKRHGDKVTGHYELIDSDGHKRIVDYTADKHSGFHATVHREPTDIKIPTHHEEGYGHHQEYEGYSGHEGGGEDQGSSHVSFKSGHAHYTY